MPPFIMAMEEGRYGLWRLRVDDDDDDDDLHHALENPSLSFAVWLR